MKKVVVTAALGILLGSGLAWAEVSAQGDTFMKETPKETVYATDLHMGFSVRSTLIDWLGGVTIVDANEVRSAERDRWWGDDVPLLPADVVRGGDR